MNLLELWQDIQDQDLKLSPGEHGDGIQVYPHPGVTTLLAMKQHKARLQPLVRGKSSCYQPGLPLPWPLGDLQRGYVYHYPLTREQLGVLNYRFDGSACYYPQHMPEAKEEGDLDSFVEWLTAMGVIDE